MPPLEDALRPLDDRFARLREEARIPGVAWGVVADGELVHAGGAGTIRDGEDHRPGADSVFRIASMTKSFTASAVLLLRDAGRLRLDEPVATYVPDLADWRPPTSDAPPVTVRQLLTMSGGLPTDDPWGDRQQGLPLDEFSRLLAAGPSFAWPPGATFEYSNLGYGILGRVVTAVAGQEYREFVAGRLLRPLGMASTAYLEDDVAGPDLAHGYVRRDEALVREGTDAYGALASMGGLFSTVRDLARWVSEFLDAFPARDDPDDDRPLGRATRREMQQLQRAMPPLLAARPVHEAPELVAGGYGFGLFVLADLDIGTVVAHSGGYPGYGSHMAWHPATGLGVIALGNRRYAPVRPVADEQLRALVRADAAPRRRLVPMPAVAGFRRVVEGLLVTWDDGVADDAFAMNMDLDEPREARRAAIERVAADLGPFRADETRPTVSESPADLAWWMRGERGWVRLAILVSPEPSPRLQRLEVTAVPDPPLALRRLAGRLLDLARDPEATWPPDLTAGPDLDVRIVERMLRAAAARFGGLRLGLPTEGDGIATATFDVDGDDGRAALTVGIDPGSGAVASVMLRAAERAAPAEAW
jgi:CubicO group peptidase (beta-lactamase class C family)